MVALVIGWMRLEFARLQADADSDDDIDLGHSSGRFSAKFHALPHMWVHFGGKLLVAHSKFDKPD